MRIPGITRIVPASEHGEYRRWATIEERGFHMKTRYYLLAAAAAMAVATPAAAKDGQAYVGIDLGAFFPKDPSDGAVFVDYTTIDVPTNAAAPP